MQMTSEKLKAKKRQQAVSRWHDPARGIELASQLQYVKHTFVAPLATAALKRHVKSATLLNAASCCQAYANAVSARGKVQAIKKYIALL